MDSLEKIHGYSEAVMTNEMKWIDKTFYETFLTKDDDRHPLEALGDVYWEKVKNDEGVSSIRFSQGEVYYHLLDYEAAIFKWEKVEGELEPWAKKNMADAFFHLGLWSKAEEVYLSISSDEKVLQIEIALQLFSLYVKENERDKAYEQIEKAIRLDPDYLGVTEMAKQFYEEQEDWKKAVSLAIHEAIRTESLEWFTVVRDYIKQGYIQNFAPKSFYTLLVCAFQVDRRFFHALISQLWSYYRTKESYLDWLHTLNDIFLNIEVELYDAWFDISTLYEETFYELIEGTYSVKALQKVMPYLLTNWLKVTTTTKALPAVAAILAWNELFPETIQSSTVQEAEELVNKASGDFIYREEMMVLFRQIEVWGERNQLQIGWKLKWLVQEIATSEQKHIIVANVMEQPKSFMSEGHIGYNDFTNLALWQYEKDEEIRIITNKEEIMWNDEDINSHHFIHVKSSSSLLERLGCKVIELPGLQKENLYSREYVDLFSLADGVVFIVQADTFFSEEFQEAIVSVKDFIHEPIRFVVTNKQASTMPKQQITFEESVLWVESMQPHLEQFLSFMKRECNTAEPKEEGKRTVQLLKLIRQIASTLANDRVEMEKELVSTIERKKRLLERLNGFHHHLQDVEKEQVIHISRSYHQLIKNMKQKMMKEIPNVMRECAKTIQEDSDFRKLHLELNDTMNERIHLYLHEQLLPYVREELNGWLYTVRSELANIQHDFLEMSDTFNRLVGEKALSLRCEEKLLEDWKRDIMRMTAKTYVEKENIMLRMKPAQMMLKSAGMLFGSIQKNKDFLMNQYKKYIEQESFSEVTQSIIQKFFIPFEMFERAIEQDIETFFREPQMNVVTFMKDLEKEIQHHEATLQFMADHYEDFEDPLTLINLKIRQWEWMKKKPEQLETTTS